MNIEESGDDGQKTSQMDRAPITLEWFRHVQLKV